MRAKRLFGLTLVAAVVSCLTRATAAEAKDEALRGDEPLLPQDLQPEEGILRVVALEGRILLDVRDHLLAEHPLRYCQMVTTGGAVGAPDVFAVYIVRNREKATAYVKRLYEPARNEKEGRVSSNALALRPESADLLEEVWEMMLERVRLPPPHPAQWNDAPTYYFDTCCTERFDLVGGQYVRGRRTERTRPERLAEVGDALVAYVEAKPADRSIREAELTTVARDLLTRLVAAGGKVPDPKARRSRAIPPMLPPPEPALRRKDAGAR